MEVTPRPFSSRARDTAKLWRAAESRMILRSVCLELLRQAAANLDYPVPVPLTHLWHQSLDHAHARYDVVIIELLPEFS